MTWRHGMLGRRPESGAIMIELVVAVGILVAAIIALGFGSAAERKALRASYWRAVAV